MKEWSIVTKPSYRSVGLKWEGTFQEIPSLKRVIEDMKGRAYELEYKINPSVQLGLSYHTVEDGFAHYSVLKFQMSKRFQLEWLSFKCLNGLTCTQHITKVMMLYKLITIYITGWQKVTTKC